MDDQEAGGRASTGPLEPATTSSGAAGADAAPGETPEQKPALSRRNFVVRALGVIGGAIAAVLGIPIAGFASAPGWQARAPFRLLSTTVAPTRRSSALTSIGRLADFEVGVPNYAKVIRPVVDGWVQEDAPVGVHVVRLSETDVAVFDPHCTHLGCPLAWSTGAKSFVCPCHGGTFNSEGKVTGGPPPHAMLQYATRIQDGEVFIGDLQAEG